MKGMPRFDAPWILALLPLGALLLAWWWRLPQPAIRFSDLRLLRDLPRGRARWVRRVRAGLMATGVTSLVIASASPRLPIPTRLTSEGIALMFVADVSGSMYQRDLDWQGERVTRLEAATRVLELLIEGGEAPGGEQFLGRPQDQLGLVTAASYPDTLVPLTLSHHAILESLRRERPKSLDAGQTNLGDAIAEALGRLEAAGDRRKVIVLLSDGEHNYTGPAEAPTWTPSIAARRAADLGVTIHTIDTGTETPGQEEIRQYGRQTLRHLAETTGGIAAAADSVSQLVEVCRRIDEFERQRLTSARYRADREIHHYFGALAAACGLVYFVLTATWGRWLP